MKKQPKLKFNIDGGVELVDMKPEAKFKLKLIKPNKQGKYIVKYETENRVKEEI